MSKGGQKMRRRVSRWTFFISNQPEGSNAPRTSMYYCHYFTRHLAGIHWIIERLTCIRKARQREAAKRKTPRALKPKDGDDCVECCNQKDEPSTGAGRSKKVVPWSEVKSRRGMKKEIVTQGQACNNKDCVYYHNMEEAEHALVFSQIIETLDATVLLDHT
jgi:hypothetical protein